VLAGHVDESLIYFIGVKQGRRSKLVQGWIGRCWRFCAEQLY
jgi:hypothetical protein